MKYGYAERLEAVSRVKLGESIRKVSKASRIDKSEIQSWLRLYDRYGRAGLEKVRNFLATPEKREGLVRMILEKGVPLSHASVENRVSISALKHWVRVVRRNGYGVLREIKKVGRPPKGGNHGKTEEERAADGGGAAAGKAPAYGSGECVAKKSESLGRGKKRPSKSEWAAAIKDLRQKYPLDMLLELGKMARSVYYYHLKRPRTVDRHAVEKETIWSIFHEHKGRYGYRRVTAEMRNRGFATNHKTVQKLMKEMDLKCQMRKVRYRSYKGEVGRIAPNIINRNFVADAPNRKWATDITQIKIGGVKLYLSPILDMFNGEIISYNISRSPNLAQVYDMLDKAFRKFDNLDGLVLHSDQGWQYQHYGYRQKLAQHNIVQSMSRKGNCLDNAMAENFFGIMKTELLYAQDFKTPEDFVKALDEYIEYYNNKRIKSRLNGMSPVQYRTLFMNNV